METVQVTVKVTHNGKKLEQPAFAFRGADGRLAVDENVIAKMANRIGYHPRVVRVSITEEYDEAA